MGTRSTWIVSALIASLGGACVGDDPQSNGGPSVDAGAEGGSSGTTVNVPDSKLTLSVEPLEILQGEPRKLVVRVERQNVTGPVDLRISNRPSGIDVPADALIPADADVVSIPVKATTESGHGSQKFQIAATLGATTASADAELFVRGAVGALDRSFGTAGRMANVPGSTFVDAQRLGDGSLVIAGVAGGLGWMRKFNGDGALDTTLGTAGIATWEGLNGSTPAAAGELACTATGCSLLTAYGKGESAYAVDGSISFEPGSSFALARTTLPPNSIGWVSYLFLPNYLVRQQNNVIWARGGSDYPDTNTTVDAFAADGAAIRTASHSWPVVLGSDHTAPRRIDAFATSTTHVFVASSSSSSTISSQSATVIDRQTGARVATELLQRVAAPESLGPIEFSTSATDGSVVVAQGRSATSICMVRLTPTGKEDAPCQFDGLGSYSAKPVPLRDGTLAVLAFLGGGRLHVFDAEGGRKFDAAGVPLEKLAELGTRVVRAFEDERGRLTVVLQGAEWNVARYWIR